MLTFIMPEYEHKNDILAFYNEFEEKNETCIGQANFKNFDAWLSGMKNRLTGDNLPEGYVRENFYLCYDKDEMVGVFSLKLELTPFLTKFGGHIGYAVKPSKRNRGFATQMMKRGLEIGKALGFNKLLAVCNEDNYASAKVIIKNGGVFENKLFDDKESVFVNRYWIYL